MAEQFRANLRQRRKESGLSQEKLARRAGRSVAMVVKLEQGHARPSFATITMLAAALGCSPADLMGPGSGIPRRTDVQVGA